MLHRNLRTTPVWSRLALAGRRGTALLVGATLLGLAPASPVGAAPDRNPASGSYDRVDRSVRELVARQPGAEVPVIVQRTSSRDGAATVRTHGGKVQHELRTANTVAATIPAGRLDELAADPSVVRIAYDAPMEHQAKPDHLTGKSPTSGSSPTTTSLLPAPTILPAPTTLTGQNLLTQYPWAVGAPAVWGYNVRGTGVGVAVLDSGIKDDRPDFLGTTTTRNVESPSTTSRVTGKVAIALENSGSPIDDNGHGTWVAGIIGARGWADGTTNTLFDQYVGIAPDANLINVKVSDRYGMARTSDVIAGLEWVIANKATYNIQVANISLISSSPESYLTSYLDAAVELAWFKGITVVVSAGNSGPNTMLFAPANDPYAIVVGATDDMGTQVTSDDQLAWFSSYGTTQDGFSKPDLVAPGRHIVGTLSSRLDPLAQLFPNNVVNPNEIRLSGTSGAAPVISGIAADVFQAARLLNVSLTPDQVKWLLLHTAQPVAGVGTGAGYGNVLAAGTFLYMTPTAVGKANAGQTPNRYLQAAYGATNSSVSWNSVSWDSVSWDNVSWENVSWQNVSWQNVSWENVSWETVAGD